MSNPTSKMRRLRLRFMKSCPRLYVTCSQFYNSFLWKDEKRAWRGEIKPSGPPSVLFYSYYRCGSMFLSRALRELALANERIHLDYDSYFAKAGSEGAGKMSDANYTARAFHVEGCYYGTLRRAYPIPDHERYRTVLLLRDPRDCLVSHYYSIRESHTLNNRNNLESRIEACASGIDDWVIAHMEDYRCDYLDFHKRLVGAPGVLFVRYEEMIAEFPEIVRQIVEHTGLTGAPAVTERILAEADFEVGSENVLSHKRSVKPGNHLKKLRAETVTRLNENLKEVLGLFGYESTSPGV